MIAGLLLTVAGIVAWPSGWADPRGVLWRERRSSRAGSGPHPARASDVAVAARLLVVALSTGLPVVVALERVADHCPEELARDLFRVASVYERAGDRPSDAWALAPDSWRPVGAALTVASTAGVAPGPLLRAAAGSVLRRESVSRESAIGAAGVRLVLPLGLVLLPAFMCTTVIPLLLVMTRDYLGP